MPRAGVEGAGVRASGSPHAADSDDAGGDFVFKARGAVVRDEAGRAYTRGELAEICSAYWNDRSKKNSPETEAQ